MMEPMAVAVHAMRNALPADGGRDRTIAVCGFGTIGILLAMFLKEAGCTRIYVIGNKDFQRKMAVETGIDEAHVYIGESAGAREWLMAQTDGAGVDVFFECVGKNETVETAVMCTASNGTVQLVGNPASDIVLEKNRYWKILRSQLTVKGSWNSSFRHSREDDLHYVLDRLQGGQIHPERYITHCLPPDALGRGLLIMRDKIQPYIKVMTSAGA